MRPHEKLHTVIWVGEKTRCLARLIAFIESYQILRHLFGYRRYRLYKVQISDCPDAREWPS